MKLHAPKQCPFCGAGLAGGGTTVAYYRCGAHIWLIGDGNGDLVIRGHNGDCGKE